ncbi:nodulin MtN3 family protein [Hibiscus syriacus]|uniref:Nodulin MtN3 family protein n=1 Tax=Hibiscus syriacus TaxID=106335 RepID=A0A6A2XRR4_HIBSY|nr:probable glucuronosyltransferase GUT1 [Hibiscus syriacus]KAE8659017.1 nodulin MtN3 family protein [Hibiscus syriacus]
MSQARVLKAHAYAWSYCTRAHQISAIFLVITATFFLTRLFDQSFPRSSCYLDNGSPNPNVNNLHVAKTNAAGHLLWPERGYGSHLSLKIYVYDENEIDGLKLLLYGRDGSVSTDDCLKGQWASQVKIHRLLLESQFRTTKKEEADLFFVPAYVRCVLMLGALNENEINQTYVKVLSQMPYFRRSGGRDHIFVFPSGSGAHVFRSWSTYLNRSIILTPEGDRADKRNVSAFNTWKDIIIPGNVDDGMTRTGLTIFQPWPLSKRTYLANYLGRAQNKVGRLKLIELAREYPDKLECPELDFRGPNRLRGREYFQHLGNAKFCFAPRGQSSWTLRFYEAFFVECVPVILSDEVELPFQNVIDYTRISIKWPSTSIGPELLDYLASIPDGVIEQIIARGRQVRCLWVYAPDSEPCSTMQALMWELQRKVRQFHQSAETFWLHNGSVVNRDLVEFANWKPPMPLP